MDSTFLNTKISKKHICIFMICVITFAALIRLILAFGERHYYDLSYYTDWSGGLLEHGFSNAYEKIKSLDYPPLFLFPLYIVGILRNIVDINANIGLDMLILKLFQVIFDIATIPLIYYVCKKYSEILALVLSLTWALNPAIIFNSSVWGQTDSLMLFLLLITYYFLENNMPSATCISFAFAGICKFQSLYFAPVILIYLFKNYKLKKALISIFYGVLTGFIIFLPFIIKSGILLPLNVYTKGFGMWPYITFNAFNVYGIFGLNAIEDANTFLLNIPISVISWIIILIAMVSIVYAFLKCKNPCPYILSFLFMQTIFMFTTRMHERYQIPVIIFLILACAKYKDLKFFLWYIVTTIIIFINQSIVFYLAVDNQSPVLKEIFPATFFLISIINVILYFITLIISTKYLNTDFYGKDKKILYENKVEV